MASPSKPSDSPESAKPKAGNILEHTQNFLDIVEKNALAPIVNSAAIEPVNTVANVLNTAIDGVNKVTGKNYQLPEIGKLQNMDVAKAEEGSAGYYTQQILGTGGSFIAYAAAGKIFGKAMRVSADVVPLGATVADIKVGSGIRALAQNDHLATVLGATTYAGFKDTKDGETHTSNAWSTLVGFSAFEVGNSLIKPSTSMLSSTVIRAAVGYVGGAAQTEVASKITTGNWADGTQISSAGLSGALLNSLLPVGQHLLTKGMESPLLGNKLPHTTDATARLHSAAVKELPEGKAPEPGSWADPEAVKALREAARADLNTRVKLNDDGPTRIDQKENVVYHAAGDDPLNLLQELAHRKIYRDPEFNKAFKLIAKDIKSPKPGDPQNASAREGFINKRLDQEIAARTEQNTQAENLGSPRRVSVNPDDILNKEGYRDNFEKEADQFIISGGKFRPAIDYSAGPGGHGAGGHDVNTGSTAHAENPIATHTDGTGGGNGSRTSDSERTRIGERARSAGDNDEHVPSNDPRDWPEAKRTSTGYENPSDEYPRGREYLIYEYPGGAEVNGHKNVVWAARYDVGGDEAMLVKSDPRTQERSVVRLRNDGLPIEMPRDGREGFFQASSVEKMFYREANDVPINLLFENDKGLRAIKYEVLEGNKLIPDDTTYTRYAYPQMYEIDGIDITPTASVEYHDGSGRVDYHQDYPFQNIITEWPEPIEDANVRYRVSVPQTIPGSHRAFALDKKNNQIGVVDIFSKDHPLDTDFGPALRVDREGASTLYQLKDGSAVLIGHYEGKMYMTRQVNGIEEPTKVFEGDDGYSEKYSKPWESIFGLVNEVKVTGSKAVYHLVNGGTAEHFADPTPFNNLGKIDWVYRDLSGDASVQLHDGSKTRIYLPKNGIDTGVAGVNNAQGVTSFEGVGGFNRFYLQNGLAMDVLPHNPGLGIIRRPGQLTLIGGVNGNWKEASFFFKHGQLPEVVESGQNIPVRRTTQPFEKCIDADNDVIDLYPEVYPNGLLTKWGLAKERHTYWTGGSHLLIDNGTKEGLEIELDAAGNRLIRNSEGQVIKTIPEPDRYPHLTTISPPRRVVTSADFPQPLATDEIDAVPIEEEPILDDETPPAHETENDDLLDSPDD